VLIEQIWTNSPLRNFNYLVACPETCEALVIDPLDAQRCLGIASDKGWRIRQILNTHEHPDHIQGNEALVKSTGARVLAHCNAADKIPHLDIPLRANSLVKVGSSVEFRVLDTPGHTMSHICLFSDAQIPVLFSGDTLFNAGVGHCYLGGHPHELYRTLSTQLTALPDTTRLYPGHDYIANNLRFTLAREPGNQKAAELLSQVLNQDPSSALITTLGLEKQVNCFFRLDNPEIIENLKPVVPELPKNPDPQAVFLALRELRNKW